MPAFSLSVHSSFLYLSLFLNVLAVLSRRFLADRSARSAAIESRIFAAFTCALTFAGRLSFSNRREIGPSGDAQTTGAFPIRPTNDETSSYRSGTSSRVPRSSHRQFRPCHMRHTASGPYTRTQPHTHNYMYPHKSPMSIERFTAQSRSVLSIQER